MSEYFEQPLLCLVNMLYFGGMKHSFFQIKHLWKSCLLSFLGFVACDSKTTTTIDDLVQTDTLTIPPDTLHRMQLVFVGDIMQHTNQIRSAAGNKANFQSKDQRLFNYEPVFRYVAPLLQQADLAVGNLELTLSGRGKYRGYPMFRTPDALATALKTAGFDLLSTCNNHSNDGFSYGLGHTIAVLDSLNIAHTGTFVDTVAYDSLYPLLLEKEVDGTTFRLVFLSYTYSTNGVETPAPYVVNDLEHDQIRRDVAKAKTLKPDVIIALMHWGREYQLLSHHHEQKTTQLLWDEGVDVVIGGHPHVIQEVALDTLYCADSTSTREVLVTYSLGNFVSNQLRPNTDLGLMFELELVKNSRQQRTTIGTHHYLPVWRYIHGLHDKTLMEGYDWTYSILPVSVFEQDGGSHWIDLSKKDSTALAQVSTKLRKHLTQHSASSERYLTATELGTLTPLLSTTNNDINE